MNKKMKLSLLTIASLLIIGCGNRNAEDNEESEIIESISSEPVEIETSESSASEEADESQVALDQRFVPEFSQVEADLMNHSAIETDGSAHFVSDFIFNQTRNSLQFSVEEMRVFELEEIDSAYLSELGMEQAPAVILIFDISITNLTDEAIYYPIDSVTLSSQALDNHVYPRSALYPSASGDLTRILESLQGEIGPSLSADGYVTFSLNEMEWQAVRRSGNVFLNVAPPYRQESLLTGQSLDPLGEARSLYLPINGYTEQMLIANSEMIQDRMSTEWWGNKEVVAEDRPNEVIEDNGVSVKINRIEMSDFTPHAQNQINFRAFPNGQIILSVEYEVSNNTNHNLLPIDEHMVAQIGTDVVESNYALINDYYGTVIEPGDTMTLIQSFALDKELYANDWQEQPILLTLTIPTETPKDVPIENQVQRVHDGTLRLNSEESQYFVDYTWNPSVVEWVETDSTFIDFVGEEEE